MGGLSGVHTSSTQPTIDPTLTRGDVGAPLIDIDAQYIGHVWQGMM